MNARVTLNIDQSILESARSFAIENGTSLDELIKNYLLNISKTAVKQPIELTPLVKAMKGSFSAPEAFDYKEQLADILSDKYK